jgi:hypothetical protein
MPGSRRVMPSQHRLARLNPCSRLQFLRSQRKQVGVDALAEGCSAALENAPSYSHPAGHDRVDGVRQLGEGVAGALVPPEGPHPGAGLVHGVVADRGQKRREVVASAACPAGAEGEAQEGDRPPQPASRRGFVSCVQTISRSNLRRKQRHQRSTSVAVAPVAEDHNHTGLGSRSPGRWSTCRRSSVPSMTGSSPWWSSQQVRWVSGVQPVPAAGRRGAVAGGLGRGGGLRFGPGGGVLQGELAAVLGRLASARGVAPRWCGQPQDPVGAQASQELDGQVGQHERQSGDVVAGVADDQDIRVARAPVSGRDQAADDGAELAGGDGGGVVGGPGADRVQHRGPAGAAALQCGDDGVGPARDQLGLVLHPPVDVAKQPLRAGRRIRAQPRADIDGKHDPAVVRGSGRPASVARSRSASIRPQRPWPS